MKKPKGKPKQTKMEGRGFERKDANPEIEAAAEKLDDLQSLRMETLKQEVEARSALALLLQKAKITVYKLDSGKVARLTTTAKATVRRPKEDEQE